MAFELPPVVAELRANITEYQEKMAQARGEMAETEESGSGLFSKLGGAAGVGLAVVAGAAIGVSAVAVDMADKFENAHARLETALSNTGSSFEEVKGPVGDLEKNFENLGYNMTDTEEALARMQGVTGNAGQSIKDLSLAADIAAARHMDLSSAVDLVGKVQEGNLGMLKRYGITLDDQTLKSKDATKALAELQARFGGQAAAQADTFSGRMKALGANLQDLMINLGNKIIPYLTTFVGGVLDAVEAVEANWPKIVNDYIKPSVEWIMQNLAPVGRFISDVFSGISQAISDFVGGFTQGTDALGSSQSKWAQWGAVAYEVFLKVKGVVMDAADAVSSALGTAFNWILQHAPGVWNVIQASVVKALQWIIDNAPKVWNAIRDGVQKGIQWLIDNVPKVWNAARDGVVKAFQWIIDNKDPVIAAISAVGAVLLGMWIADAAEATIAAAATIAALAPFIAAAAAVAALAGAAVYAYEHWQAFRNAVDAVVTWVKGTLVPAFITAWHTIQEQTALLVAYISERWEDIKTAVENVIKVLVVAVGIALAPLIFIWQHAHDQIMAILTAAWEFMKAYVEAAINIVKGIIDVVVGLLSGDWGRAWDGIKQILQGVWDGIVALVQLSWQIVQNFIEAGLGILKGLWQTAWDGLKSIISTAWDGIKTAVSTGIGDLETLITALPGKITGWLGDLGSLLLQSGVDLITGFLNGMKQSITDVIAFLVGLPAKIESIVPSMGDILFSIGQSVINGLWSGMKSVWDNVTGWLSDLNPANWFNDINLRLGHAEVNLVPTGQAVMGGLQKGLERGWDSNVVPFLASRNPALAFGPVSAPAASPAVTNNNGVTLHLTVNNPNGDAESMAKAIMREAAWTLRTKAS